MKILVFAMMVLALGLVGCAKDNGSSAATPTTSGPGVRLQKFDNQRSVWNKDARCTAQTHSDLATRYVNVTMDNSNDCPGYLQRIEVTFVCDTNLLCEMVNKPTNTSAHYGLILVNDQTFSISYTDSSGYVQEWTFTH